MWDTGHSQQQCVICFLFVSQKLLKKICNVLYFFRARYSVCDKISHFEMFPMKNMRNEIKEKGV